MEYFLTARALEGAICGGSEVVANSAGGGVGVVVDAVEEAIVTTDAADGRLIG